MKNHNSNKKNEVQHARSKFISNYGGVGSIIDTLSASVLIETFDNWKYPDYFADELAPYIIQDDRLLARLRVRFGKLKRLVAIPTESQSNWKAQQPQPQANYFPKWFYCPRCHRFGDYFTWKKTSGKTEFDLHCHHADCHHAELEQVRFVLTCQNGHIQDLPWKHWNNRFEGEVNTNENEEHGYIQIDNDDDTKQSIYINFKSTCCEKQDLRYKVSAENTELSGIFITCENCKKSATLKGVFGYKGKCGGRKYWLGLQGDEGFKGEPCGCKGSQVSVKIKSTNSLYYANTLSSIWIPKGQIVQLTEEHRRFLDNGIEEGKTSEEVVKDLFVYHKIPKELSNQYLNQPESTLIPEIIFRKSEYDYFLSDEPNDEYPQNSRFKKINIGDEIPPFAALTQIHRLKKITVQTSFTRQEPIDTDSILIGENGEYGYKVKRQPISKNDFNTKILPAVESYGEGILFVLDNQKLQKFESNEAMKNRVEWLKSSAGNSHWQAYKTESTKLTVRKVLIHTLAHLVMRELQYVCGYPMSSLQERLYVSDDMCGFLIAAFDGAEGYLGGLSNLCNDSSNLNKIIQSAIARAKECSLDPICGDSTGQGVYNLNLAACHSCTLVPETSCEHGNLFLDRRIIIEFFEQ